MQGSSTYKYATKPDVPKLHLNQRLQSTQQNVSPGFSTMQHSARGNAMNSGQATADPKNLYTIREKFAK